MAGWIQSHTILEESLEDSSGRLRACTNEHGEGEDGLFGQTIIFSLLDLIFNDYVRISFDGD